MEIWRDIPEYKGYYQASNYGRVRSIPRKIFNGKSIQNYKGKVLKAQIKDKEHDKYLVVTLCRCGTEKQRKVHRLVLFTFKGKCPPNMEGCHNDGDIYNNRPSNLRWDTRSGNMKDKRKHGTSQHGENSTNVLLTEPDVLKMRKIYSRRSHTLKQLAQMFGVSESGVKSIIYRKNWTHI